MSATLFVTGYGDETPMSINFNTLLKQMNDDEFLKFCQANPDFRIEMTKDGEIIIRPPTNSRTGNKNFKLNTRFGIWVEQDGTGEGFDSSAGFTLPNGAKRSPDASWIRKVRWEALTEREQKRFAPICPDFVVELRSETDLLKTLQKKMAEYIENGAQLGWLIDPLKKKVYVYRPSVVVEVLDDPQTVSGEPVLQGFVLKVQDLWS
jgi:Uma2 family endonuclease